MHPQSDKFNANEFTDFLANLRPFIAHLKNKNGNKYRKGTKQKYERIVLFLKENQHQIKLATDEIKLDKILSNILKAKNPEMQKQLALDAFTLYKSPEIESIFKSNPLANRVRKYLKTIYRNLNPMKRDYYLELKDFYEENKELFDSYCNFILTESY